MIELLQAAIREYYTHEETGGRYHIVLDDYNVEDGHIEWCMEQEVGRYYQCPLDLPWCSFQADMIGAMLLSLPEPNRVAVIKGAHELV